METKNIKLDIDNESVHIYIDNGEFKDVTSLYYWHIDEVEDDASVALVIASAIQLYYTNTEKLIY